MFQTIRPAMAANGFVDRLRTAFVVQGSMDEVGEFLDRLFVSLRNLPLDRLDLERQILLTEAATTPISWFDRHLSLRYGPMRHGLGTYRHLGLHKLTPEQVADWAERFFVRDNMAIWMTRRPPPSLRVNLVQGERYIPALQPPLEGLRLPAIAEGIPNLVSVSSVVKRSFAAVVAASVLGYEAFETLRKDLGITYQPWVIYEPITADHADFALACDCVEPNQTQVWTDLAALLQRFASEGPSDDHLHSSRSVQQANLPGPLLSPHWIHPPSTTYWERRSTSPTRPSMESTGSRRRTSE